MRKYLLYCALTIAALLSIRDSYAQTDTAFRPKSMIRITPLCLIDPYEGPALQLGAERWTKSRWAYGLDGRYYLPGISGFVTKTKVVGYAVIPCVKYYYASKSLRRGKAFRQYVALQYTFKDQAYDYDDSIRLRTGARIAKTARMHQITNTLSLMWGDITIHKSGVTIDGYVGIGVRLYNSHSNLTSEEQDGIIDQHDWTDPTEWPIRSVGAWVYPNICAGFRVGYLFR